MIHQLIQNLGAEFLFKQKRFLFLLVRVFNGKLYRTCVPDFGIKFVSHVSFAILVEFVSPVSFACDSGGVL